MANHYSDYRKKSVPSGDLVFDKVSDSDKKLVRSVRRKYLKSNAIFLVIVSLGFIGSTWYFINFLCLPVDRLVYQIIVLVMFGAASFICASNIYRVIAGVKGIRKGIILTSSREQENKNGRNSSYQYLFDIYFEDRDETLMSFEVEQLVFSQCNPGDGVIVAKCGNKIIVFEDPDRKSVMDVSKIKSGI